jgi:hypothetical protein
MSSFRSLRNSRTRGWRRLCQLIPVINGCSASLSPQSRSSTPKLASMPLPTNSDNLLFVSNEASGVLGDVDVEIRELSLAGERSILRYFSNSVSLYFLQFILAPTQAPGIGEGSSSALARARSVRVKRFSLGSHCKYTCVLVLDTKRMDFIAMPPAPIIPTARFTLTEILE